MSKHFAWEFVTENRLLMLHDEQNPTDAEWDDYMKALSGHKPSTLGLLVLTIGGAPTTVQRGKLNAWIGKSSYKRAVVMDNMLIRGVLTALAWFDPSIKGFSPQQLREAFMYLGLNEADQALYRTAIARMKANMDVGSSWLAKL